MVAFVVGFEVVSDLVDQALIVRKVSKNSKLSVVDSGSLSNGSLDGTNSDGEVVLVNVLGNDGSSSGHGCGGCNTRVESTLRRAVQSVAGITVGNLGSSFFKTKFVPLRTVACPGVLRVSADVTELRATRAAVTCQ